MSDHREAFRNKTTQQHVDDIIAAAKKQGGTSAARNRAIETWRKTAISCLYFPPLRREVVAMAEVAPM